MQRLDPDTIMAVLPHAHVFTNEEGKGWGHGLIYLPEMLSLLYLVYAQGSSYCCKHGQVTSSIISLVEMRVYYLHAAF